MALCRLSYSCLHSHSSPVFHSYWFLSFPGFCLCRLCEIKQLTSSGLRAINHCRCLTIRMGLMKNNGPGRPGFWEMRARLGWKLWEGFGRDGVGVEVLGAWLLGSMCVCVVGEYKAGEWGRKMSRNVQLLPELVNCWHFISTIQCRHSIKKSTNHS